MLHVGEELHVPLDVQVMKESPTLVYPVSQLIIATSPYVVPFGVSAVPLTGAGSPQSEIQATVIASCFSIMQSGLEHSFCMQKTAWL
jgi:hypothetical protein